MQNTNDKVLETTNKILELFNSSELPKKISYIINPSIETPQSDWSFTNQLICLMNNSEDSRGFSQWKKVGRFVKKGSKSFSIFAPKLRTIKEKDGAGKEIKKQICIGFKAIPIFSFRSTEGKSIDYPTLTAPEFNYMDVLEHWSIKVTPISGNSPYYGCYSDSKQEINIATEEEVIFYHELIHASQYRLTGKHKAQTTNGQDPEKEIVAEMGACILAYLDNKEIPSISNHKEYIQRYADQEKISITTAISKYLETIIKAVSLILETSKELSSQKEMCKVL